MSSVTFLLPDELLQSLKVDSNGLATEVRMAAAAKLFELGRLSSGAAATLAGVPRTVFLAKLADYGVPTFKLSEDELSEELRRA